MLIRAIQSIVKWKIESKDWYILSWKCIFKYCCKISPILFRFWCVEVTDPYTFDSQVCYIPNGLIKLGVCVLGSHDQYVYDQPFPMLRICSTVLSPGQFAFNWDRGTERRAERDSKGSDDLRWFSSSPSLHMDHLPMRGAIIKRVNTQVLNSTATALLGHFELWGNFSPQCPEYSDIE